MGDLHASPLAKSQSYPVMKHGRLQNQDNNIGGAAYMWENTAGNLAWRTLVGKGCNQRSGTHSSASAPQMFLLRL